MAHHRRPEDDYYDDPSGGAINSCSTHRSIIFYLTCICEGNGPTFKNSASEAEASGFRGGDSKYEHVNGVVVVEATYVCHVRVERSCQ